MRKAILACLFLVFLLAACSPKDDAASIEGTELKTHQAKATVTNITETDDDIEITVYEEKFDTNVTFVKRKDKLDEDSPIRSYKITVSGIARRIDDLGRIVIPMELRKSLGWREGDLIDISLGKDGVVFNKVATEDRIKDTKQRLIDLLRDEAPTPERMLAIRQLEQMQV